MEREPVPSVAEENREPLQGSLKRKISLQGCEICNTEEAKYRCPRCMKYSCSLACVQKHKSTFNCNGVREKTAFVPVNEFSDLHLLSDYRFLEDAGRLADCAARDHISHRPQTNKFKNLDFKTLYQSNNQINVFVVFEPLDSIPEKVHFLRNRARKYNIQLQTLPVGFSKRRENSTFFSNKEQKFYWHLKLVFPHSHAKFTEKRVPDDKPLCDILKPYIDPQESDPIICQRLKIYTMSPQSDIQILMKVENRPHNSLRYEELDVNKGLLDNLKGKTVVEYPTLLVVLQKLKTDMVILGHDKKKETNAGSKDLIKESSSEEEGEIHDSS